jgi:hypothetical protein
VLLSHLTDPQEREKVKAELGRRYYEHYLQLATATGTPPPPAEAPLPPDGGPTVGGQAEAGEAAEAGDDLADVAPLPLPKLPPTPPASKPPPPSQKAAESAKQRCFIATAAYASPQAPQVLVLRRFRDRCLSGRPWGERFLTLYYQASPAVAATLASCPRRQRLARLFLSPLAWCLDQVLQAGSRRPGAGSREPGAEKTTKDYCLG